MLLFLRKYRIYLLSGLAHLPLIPKGQQYHIYWFKYCEHYDISCTRQRESNREIRLFVAVRQS